MRDPQIMTRKTGVMKFSFILQSLKLKVLRSFCSSIACFFVSKNILELFVFLNNEYIAKDALIKSYIFHLMV